MGSRLSAGTIFFITMFLATTSYSAVEKEIPAYGRTVLHYEGVVTQAAVTRIKDVMQRNDHAARIFLDPKRKNLIIIHHKSLSVSDLEAIFAEIGIPVEHVALYANKSIKNPLPPPHPGISALALRNCGATMDTWKKLLHKYLH